MDFYAVLDQAVDLLWQRGRVTYRALKIQFQLDDDQMEALKDELLFAHQPRPRQQRRRGKRGFRTSAPRAGQRGLAQAQRHRGKLDSPDFRQCAHLLQKACTR